jgi:hypothetical protein
MRESEVSMRPGDVKPRRTVLDGLAARLAALALAAALAALLLHIHRKELFPQPPAPQEVRQDDAFTSCFAPRLADIEQMVQDGMAKPEQAALFRSRAEAMCRAEAAKAAGAAPGAPPGLPPAMQPSRRF